MGLLTNNKVRFPVKAIEDSLLYCIPQDIFQELYDNFDSFADFVEVENSARLRQAVSENNDANDLTTSKVKTLLTRDAPTIERGQTIQEAAQLMAQDNVSSLLIVDPEFVLDEDDPQSPVVGIITDRDLCTRVLAEGLSPQDDVSTVMTTEVISLDHNAYVYEAMLTMLRYNVHHLPVVKDQMPIGIIEATDIVRYESQNSLLLVSSIFQQQTIEDLAIVADEVKSSFVRLVNEDANSHMVGSAMSVIGRSFKQRLLEMAEEELGPPPIPYCFLALGSMGRDEQLLVTDQDNAIILDDTYKEDKHGKYFEALAQYVSDGLNVCGYKYCTGDIMATNPEWRMTRSQWKSALQTGLMTLTRKRY